MVREVFRFSVLRSDVGDMGLGKQESPLRERREPCVILPKVAPPMVSGGASVRSYIAILKPCSRPLRSTRTTRIVASARLMTRLIRLRRRDCVCEADITGAKLDENSQPS